MFVDPELMVAAATDVAAIGSAMNSATAAAEGPTTSLTAAAADEVSAAAAALFSTFGQEYQAISRHAAAFHEQFIQTLSAASSAYAMAEAANATPLLAAPSQLSASVQALIDGNGAGATGTAAAVSPLTGTTFGLILGGTWMPIPTTAYVAGALNYVNQTFNVLPENAQAVYTPAQGYPVTGVKSLIFNTSVSQGLEIMDSAIKQQLAADPTGSVAVLGYSQSAAIASLEMRNLANPALNPSPPNADQLGFTLMGNPMNPNGGLFSRFEGLNLVSLGLEFYGSTPSDTIYPTEIYTLEYDGFAHFPRYPINLLADINALAGIYYVHSTYADIDPAALPDGYAMHELPTSPGYSGNTTYYMITYEDLPILEPLRSIPLLGNPIADLLQPNLTTIVNLGYGGTDEAWSGYADRPTEFGLFPSVNAIDVASELVAGTQQGANDFATSLDTEISSLLLPDTSDLLTSLTTTGGSSDADLLTTLSSAWTVSLSASSIIDSIQTANTNIVDSISNAAAIGYSILLPTADIANALVTSAPSYEFNLFLDGIEQALYGDPMGLVNAIGYPLAANTALWSLAIAFELIAIAWQIEYG